MFLKLQLIPITGATTIPVPWATGFDALDNDLDSYIYRNSAGNNSPFLEMILTPFHQSMWEDLWYVKLINKDQRGIMQRLAHFMKERKINIVSVVSNTIYEGEYHVSRVAIDCKFYESIVDGNYKRRRENPNARLDRLEREIALVFLDELKFFNLYRPSITIERDQSLWRLYNEWIVRGITVGQRVKIVDGCVEIPEKFLNYIKRRFPDAQNSGNLQGLLSFEQDSDLIRLSVFSSNKGVAQLNVSVENAPGAIAELSQLLSDEGFNIISIKACTFDEEERIFLWILIQNQTAQKETIDDAEMIAAIQDIIINNEAVGKFNPEIHEY